ncbi:MAG: copper chaperone PCu(A)C [Chloroflexi bacterium]|nr:copper chaperone PCu(A)C [Chloroflexota bacterium]
MTSPLRAWWRLAAAALAVLAVGTFVACDDEDDGDAGGSIEISNARARFTTTDVGAVYFDIRSTGPGDRLVSASAEIAADTQVHEIVSEGGSSMMRPVEGGIPIDPGGHVSLQPGGYHVMVLGVSEIPEPGATFEVVLEFERAGRMTITVHVQEFGDDDGDMDHEEGMDHE